MLNYIQSDNLRVITSLTEPEQKQKSILIFTQRGSHTSKKWTINVFCDSDKLLFLYLVYLYAPVINLPRKDDYQILADFFSLSVNGRWGTT